MPAIILTMPPDRDIGPHHDRKIVILQRTALAYWPDLAVPAQSLIRPLPHGTLNLEQVE
jgi:putative SOS response-associated peptidase YedK